MFPLVLLFLSTILAQKVPILWSVNAKGVAKTSVNPSGVTNLYTKKDLAAGNHCDTQVLYTKQKWNLPSPLVTVFLQDSSILPPKRWTLMLEFDMLSQECSCYYINVTDLNRLFPDMVSSSNYALAFTNPSMDLISGKFGIEINDKPIVPEAKINVPAIEKSSVSSTFSNWIGGVSAIMGLIFW